MVIVSSDNLNNVDLEPLSRCCFSPDNLDLEPLSTCFSSDNTLYKVDLEPLSRCCFSSDNTLYNVDLEPLSTTCCFSSDNMYNVDLEPKLLSTCCFLEAPTVLTLLHDLKITITKANVSRRAVIKDVMTVAKMMGVEHE